jgi:hypothetical protein
MKKYRVAFAVALTVIVAAPVWWLSSREKATIDRSADVHKTEAAVASMPAPAQSPEGLSATHATPHRTVMTSSYTVPNSPASASPAIQNESATGKTSDGKPALTDAEALNKVVSPTGSSEDEFNRVKLMHNRLVTEPRDDTWASQAEAQLQTYLTAAMGPERVSLVSVQCASTVCEIQAATRVPGNVSADLDDWQKIIFTMAEQPWWAEYQFNEPSNRVQDAPDKQRALFIAYITRSSAQG